MLVTDIFSGLFKRVLGWDMTEFVYYRPDGSINHNVPFSTSASVISITIFYWVSVYGLTQFMKSRKPPHFKPLFAIHNALLSFFSLILLTLLMETIIPTIWNRGFYFSICSEEMWAGGKGRRLELFYYINYLFKFYELIDTYFMVLSKKNIEFLHIYHHTATYWLCFTQLNGNTSVQWFVISFNLFVHVVMYYYYARAAMGAQIWWKKYLTTLQIVQFVFDICICYFCTTIHYGGVYVPWLIGDVDCYGTPFAAIVGCGILTSYLLLFIQFFFHTYTPKSREGTEKKKTT